MFDENLDTEKDLWRLFDEDLVSEKDAWQIFDEKRGVKRTSHSCQTSCTPQYLTSDNRVSR